MDSQKFDVRELFLNNFVYELIKNTKSNQNSNLPPVEIKETVKPSQPIAMQKLKNSVSPMPPRQTNKSMPQVQQPKIFKPFPQVQAPIRSLNKIGFLIKDPAITEIECIGENESLLVKKGGVIQKTQVALKSEEIKGILDEFSAKTSIPIIEGTFKAALENLIITAVISEILGPRFIIQKRNPFQPLSIANSVG